MLRHSPTKRSTKENLWLAATTAYSAGAVNVASVIAFFAFTSNVTGHVAIFAEELVKGHWHQVFIVLIWLLLFLFGAFAANFIISSVVKKGKYFSNSAPIFLEIVVLAFITVYGHFYYQETLRETEWLIGGLLFCMGLQNGMVSTISGGVVKTTHVTGLFTDLGAELSQWLHPITPRTKVLKDRLKLRLYILSYYILGGLVGGYFFLLIDFLAFIMVILVLIFVIYYDMSRVVTKLTIRKIKKPAYVIQEQN
ncbi:YoaK family protein [Pleomorphovibrio marinus]|uniref:YoaK family protein n=1 Tax=Pleomorphovibrio marinus TaxID=2164132 RepID=UPI000E0BD92C|nr:YoaK family protein [Pleomorphovibrio marinus]